MPGISSTNEYVIGTSPLWNNLDANLEVCNQLNTCYCVCVCVCVCVWVCACECMWVYVWMIAMIWFWLNYINPFVGSHQITVSITSCLASWKQSFLFMQLFILWHAHDHVFIILIILIIIISGPMRKTYSKENSKYTMCC